MHCLGALKCILCLQDISEPTVFSAIKESGNYAAGQYIEGFTEYLANYGDSFDALSGTFTADRDGVFDFSASFFYSGKKDNRISVNKNGKNEVIFRAYTHDLDHDTLSFSWIMELNKGDQIRLLVTVGHFYCNSQYTCMFDGKFIR